MKLEKNPKYNTIALLVLLVVAFVSAVVSFLLNFGVVSSFIGEIVSVIMPLIYAFVLVLALSPAVNFFKEKFEKLLKAKKNYRKKAMALSVLTTYMLVLILLSLALWIVISQLTRAYEFVAKFTDVYFPILNGIISDISENDQAIGAYLTSFAKGLKDAANDLVKNVPNLAKAIGGFLGSTVSSISQLVLGVIISIYALFRLDQIKVFLRRANAALFPSGLGKPVARALGEFYRNLGAYLSSRIYNTVILAVVMYVVFLVMRLEFFSLVALVVAVCSFIPGGIVVGGSIGAFVVLVTDTRMIGWYIAVVAILGIIDLVYLCPLVTNKRVRVSFGTTVACVLIGLFVGKIIGAALALPVYVTVRTLVFEWYENKNKPKDIEKE